MKRILALCVLCVTSALSAYTQPCPGEWALSAEWLYMLSAYDQPYYAFAGQTSGDDQRRANDQSWHSAYRLEASYAFCERPCRAHVRWTHFPSYSESASNSGQQRLSVLNPAFAGLVTADEVSIRDEFDFYYLEALVDHPLCGCDLLDLRLVGGLQYAHLDLDETITLLNADLTTYRSRRWGIGPQLGIDFTYCLTQCFTLTGRAQTALLISDRTSKMSNASFTTDVQNTHYWDLMPAVDMRFGVSYTGALDLSCFSCCSCLGPMCFDLELGYEVLHYHKGLDRTYFPNSNDPAISFDQLMDFTLHGPYVHAGLTF